MPRKVEARRSGGVFLVEVEPWPPEPGVAAIGNAYDRETAREIVRQLSALLDEDDADSKANY
jgi:hypothetical protein